MRKSTGRKILSRKAPVGWKEKELQKLKPQGKKKARKRKVMKIKRWDVKKREKFPILSQM